ncbi:MAG: helix-turn-helix domain-containing protein [Actinomycetota bacterium]|nr:helix-turn-helix domain-containing protein [Actinomycetota bacterium]
MNDSAEDLARLARLRRLLSVGLASAVREDAGVSLREAARVVGVSRQTLAAWERSDWTPRRERTAALRYLALLDRLMSGGRVAA